MSSYKDPISIASCANFCHIICKLVSITTSWGYGTKFIVMDGKTHGSLSIAKTCEMMAINHTICEGKRHYFLLWHFMPFLLSTFSLFSLAFFQFPFLSFKALTLFSLFLSLFPFRYYFHSTFKFMMKWTE